MQHSDDSRSEERQDEFTPAILLVILGASGDLTKRLLLPSLYNLASVQALPDDFRLLGVATEEWDDAAMRAHVKDSIAKFWGEHPDEAITGWIAERTFYQQTDLKDEAAYAQLAQRVQESEEQLLVKNVNRLFYLALAPDFIAPVTAQLARAQMFADQEGSWRRLIIEKPFGRDHDSAVELTRDLRKSLRDEQIYRIDHFIGKEALHDIAVVRFANVFSGVYLASRSCRQCSDHRCRDGRVGEPCCVLRKIRSLAGYGAEPHRGTAVRRGHGAPCVVPDRRRAC